MAQSNSVKHRQCPECGSEKADDEQILKNKDAEVCISCSSEYPDQDTMKEIETEVKIVS